MRVVLKIGLAAVIAFALLGWMSWAKAERVDHCAGWDPLGENCHVTITATAKPKTLVIFGPDAGHHFATRWVMQGREFLTGIQDECDGAYRGFGRFGQVRVVETACGGGLRIRVRSVGEPTRVRFEFAAL